VTEGCFRGFWHFWHPPSVSAFGKLHALLSPTQEKLTDRLNAPVQGTGADGLKLALALLWERRDECPGAVPVLVCHDEVVVECDAEQAGDVKAWLEKAMIEGMDAVMNGADEVDAPVEVEARIARSWGEGGQPYDQI
jgi:DNA polymerase I-like protein with 3'-5' exonuclease and polymerase domains